MDAFAAALNDLLVNTFHSILKLEEESLSRIGAFPLSISEMHLLEAVGRGRDAGRSITDIAKELSITLPSVTAAVNKLAKKGYLLKEKCENDRRMVFVRLSEEGRRAGASHRFFHRHMVNSASLGLKEDEKAALIRGLNNLHAFFRSQEHAWDQLLPKLEPTRQEERST